MTPSRNRLIAAAMLLAAPLVVLGSYLFSVSSSDSPAQFVQDVAAAHTGYVVGWPLLTRRDLLLIPAADRPDASRAEHAEGAGCRRHRRGAERHRLSRAGRRIPDDDRGPRLPHPRAPGRRDRGAAGGNTSGLAGLPFVFAPLLVLGLVISGTGLLTGGLRPRWLPLVLTVGAVALHFAPDSPFGSLLHLPVAVAIAGLGAELLRAGASAPGTDRAPAATVAEQV